ncbi:esterase FrsA [Rahnella bonaserana]|jgi:esterase FrsA|uniref:Esterase FrsA n=1 Tax=Rahnella bonaserana TaxID=2816248 RepID=A0ABS6LYS2_9GAMM|nr:esterase FrsA [Rahnella bonaserana]MBU9857136.1 esterase FrsA [Rahnella bonaserana]WHZ41637.1 esterase FrsA [Rahnella bonaserana]
MAPANLTEKLFKPSFKYPETSTLVRRVHHHNTHPPMHTALEGDTVNCWYRTINRLMWMWRGVDPLEVEEVLSRIAVSKAEHSDPLLLDTVIGYRNGNWVYEWSNQAMAWQQKAAEEKDPNLASEYWLKAANLYSIAGYPHLKGDTLAEQSEALANKAFEKSSEHSPYSLKEIEFKIQGGAPIIGFLHLPNEGKAPFPTVMVCGGLDTLQSDHQRLFRSYLAPMGIAMLTIDMPSIGFSSKWKLTQDTSFLHQQVLHQLADVAWVDASRVSLLGYRFGANVAVRLAYLEPRRVCAVATLGALVHSLLSDPKCQEQVPDMYMDVLASRIGMSSASDSALKTELNRYSLKMQGLLGRRTPTPMLAAYWENDIFSPKAEARLIADSSSEGKLLAIQNEPLYEHFDKALHEICEWLQKHMR